MLSFCLRLCGLWIQIMSMLRKVGLATLDQQDGHDEPCRLRASDKQLQRLRQVAVLNVLSSGPVAPQKLFVIGGPPSPGRTRLGYEALRMAVDREKALFQHLQYCRAAPLHVVLIYINFSSRLKLEQSLDLSVGVSTSERSGARIAATLLSLPMSEVRRLIRGNVLGLTVGDVLDAGVHGAVSGPSEQIASEKVHSLHGKPFVLFAVHMDEYRLYTKQLIDLTNWSRTAAQEKVRSKLSLLKDYVSNDYARAGLPAKVALFPVVSWTPYDGVHILWT